MRSQQDPPGKTLLSKRHSSPSDSPDAPPALDSTIAPAQHATSAQTNPSDAFRHAETHLEFKDQVRDVPMERRAHGSTLPRFKDQVQEVDPHRQTQEIEGSFTAGNYRSPRREDREPNIETIGIVEATLLEEDKKQEPGFPPAPFADPFQDVSFLDDLKNLQNEIKTLKSLKECYDLYKSSSFSDGLNLIRSAQKQFVLANSKQSVSDSQLKELWAEKWAHEKNKPRTKDTEWAWILDECRKTSLGLLYKMCDFGMGKEEEQLDEDDKQKETPVIDKLRRDDNSLMVVDSIAGLCLVMDRANCLYHMGHDASNVTGLVWYRKDTEDSLPEYWKNPTGSLMNKRLSWLFDEVLNEKSKSMLAPWMEVALPPRLRPREP